MILLVCKSKEYNHGKDAGCDLKVTHSPKSYFQISQKLRLSPESDFSVFLRQYFGLFNYSMDLSFDP